MHHQIGVAAGSRRAARLGIAFASRIDPTMADRRSARPRVSEAARHDKIVDTFDSSGPRRPYCNIPDSERSSTCAPTCADFAGLGDIQSRNPLKLLVGVRGFDPPTPSSEKGGLAKPLQFLGLSERFAHHLHRLFSRSCPETARNHILIEHHPLALEKHGPDKHLHPARASPLNAASERRRRPRDDRDADGRRPE